MKSWQVFFTLISTVILTACSETGSNTTTHSTDSLSSQIDTGAGFRNTIDGKLTDLFVLKNSNGMMASVTNYGGRLVSLMVPDKDGNLRDVVVGFKSANDYVNSTEPYFGATIGRYGNRIAKGKFSLEGKQYELFTNNGPNTLHGGKKGFQAAVWNANKLNDTTLTYLSKDGIA